MSRAGVKNKNQYDARRVRFCPAGHDKDVVGRTNQRRCFSCNSLRGRTINWRRDGILNEDGKPFSANDFNRHFQIQGGKCKLCGVHQSEEKRALAVEHDHATNKFRGLVCYSCNVHIIGSNTVETATKLVAYLEAR